MSFEIFEYFILFILILFQSIFGVGLLIFGTPTFLVFGYNFAETLSILVPISCTVSLCQILSTKIEIDKFKKIFYKYSIFGTAIFMLFPIIFININFLKIIIAFIMISISIISLTSMHLKNYRKKFLEYSRSYLVTLGCIHGLTNLGGSFISIFSSIFYYRDKLRSRKSIAFSYFVLGLIQLLVLSITLNIVFKLEILILMIITPFVFYLSSFIFDKINFEFYIKILYLLILFYGIFIITSLV